MSHEVFGSNLTLTMMPWISDGCAEVRMVGTRRIGEI